MSNGGEVKQQFLLDLTKVNISKQNMFLKSILQGNPSSKIYLKSSMSGDCYFDVSYAKIFKSSACSTIRHRKSIDILS